MTKYSVAKAELLDRLRETIPAVTGDGDTVRPLGARRFLKPKSTPRAFRR